MKVSALCSVCFALILVATMCGPLMAAPSVSFEGAAPTTYKLGKTTIYTIQDVARAMPVNIFSGADAEKIRSLAPDGTAPSSVYVFVIKTGGKVILVDTGYGKADNPKSWLLTKLALVGVKPQDITHVLFTHLHGDHVGGLAWDGKAAFPNAEVLVSAPEKDYWLDPETLKTNPGRKGNIELIQTNFALYDGKVKTFAFGDTVLPGITSVAAVGHTPGHTAFLLESGGKRVLFWGDIVHAAALQFPDPRISAQYDMDVPKAVAARIVFMEMAAQKKIPVAGAHLPAPGVVRVKTGKVKGEYIYTMGM